MPGLLTGELRFSEWAWCQDAELLAICKTKARKLTYSQMCPHCPIDSPKCHGKVSVFLKSYLLRLEDGSVGKLLPYKHGEPSSTPRTKPHKNAKDIIILPTEEETGGPLGFTGQLV